MRLGQNSVVGVLDEATAFTVDASRTRLAGGLAELREMRAAAGQIRRQALGDLATRTAHRIDRLSVEDSERSRGVADVASRLCEVLTVHALEGRRVAGTVDVAVPTADEDPSIARGPVPLLRRKVGVSRRVQTIDAGRGRAIGADHRMNAVSGAPPRRQVTLCERVALGAVACGGGHSGHAPLTLGRVEAGPEALAPCWLARTDHSHVRIGTSRNGGAIRDLLRPLAVARDRQDPAQPEAHHADRSHSPHPSPPVGGESKQRARGFTCGNRPRRAAECTPCAFAPFDNSLVRSPDGDTHVTSGSLPRSLAANVR